MRALLAAQDIPLRVLGDSENGEHVMAVEGGLGVGERVGSHFDRDRFVCVQRLHEVAAELGMVLIDDGDRDAAKNLAEIGLGIERSVNDRREHDQPHHAAVGENCAGLRCPSRSPRLAHIGGET